MPKAWSHHLLGESGPSNSQIYRLPGCPYLPDTRLGSGYPVEQSAVNWQKANRLGPSCPQVWTSLVAQRVKWLPTMRETRVQSLDREDPLEKEIATYSSTLAWKIP